MNLLLIISKKIRKFLLLLLQLSSGIKRMNLFQGKEKMHNNGKKEGTKVVTKIFNGLSHFYCFAFSSFITKYYRLYKTISEKAYCLKLSRGLYILSESDIAFLLFYQCTCILEDRRMIYCNEGISNKCHIMQLNTNSHKVRLKYREKFAYLIL